VIAWPNRQSQSREMCVTHTGTILCALC
jgi:hypothetical protein